MQRLLFLISLAVSISFDEDDYQEEKYFLVHWNHARLNNQVLNLAAAMNFAKTLNRTLVLVDEDIENPGHRQFWNGSYIDFPLINKYVKTIQFRDLGMNKEDMKQYEVSPNGVYHGHKMKYIDINGRLGVVENPETATVADRYTTWKDDSVFDYIQPAKYLKDEADEWMQQTFGGPPKLAVHGRMFQEDGKSENKLCYNEHAITGSRWIFLHQMLGKRTKEEKEVWYNQFNRTCSPTWDAIKEILDFNSVPIPDTFFLGTDGWGKLLDQLNVTGGARSHKDVGWHNTKSRKTEMAELQPCKKGMRDCPVVNELTFLEVELSLQDMYIMSKAEFFVGSIFSTLSGMVCRWRGKNLAHYSNICRVSDAIAGGIVNGKAPPRPPRPAGKNIEVELS